MKLISFALTRPQFEARRKTVTRRLGWKDLRPGQLLCGCDQIMGLNGKPLIRLAIICVTDVRREPLHAIDDDDVWREGFNMPAHEFVEMFCENMNCQPETEVTRIAFQFVPGGRLT